MTLAEQLQQTLTQAQDIAAQRATPRDRLVQLRALIEQIFRGLTRYADVTLADHFARIEYCKRLGHVPAALIAHAHRFRKTANRVVHETEYAGTDEDVQSGVDLVVAIARFAQIETPDIVIARVEDFLGEELWIDASTRSAPPPTPTVALQAGSRTSLRVLALSPVQHSTNAAGGAQLEIVLDLGDEPVVKTLHLNGPWSALPAWPFSTLWLHDCEVAIDGALVADEHSLVVVEPDIAVNATALGKCYIEGPANIALHFGKLIEPVSIGKDLTAGNIGSHAFARMLTEPSHSNEELLDLASEACLDELALLTEPEAGSARQKIAGQLPVLLHTAVFAREGNTAVEAFFIADRLGLQGKPDALVHHRRGDFVLELKSGKAAYKEREVPLQAGRSIKSAARMDHLVQAACYAMIQQEVEGRAVTPVVLYPQESSKEKQSCRVEMSGPLRVEIITTRNALVAAEHQIVNGRTPYASASVGQAGERSFNRETFNAARQFARVFEVVHEGKGSERRMWFVRQIQHIYRELWAERLGTVDGAHARAGFSSLWTDPDLVGKVKRGEALVAMRERPDLRNDRELTFEMDPAILATCEFREDDIVLLFPQVGGDRAPTCRRLLKARFGGRVASDARLVRVELNDPLDAPYLAAHPQWALSRDQSDASANQLAALWSLATSAPQRVDLLTGVAAPGLPPVEHASATTEVDALVARAAAAPDYFLLQGPPGTGKTRRFLPALVRERLAHDPRPILAVAFTNRAVDEMRGSLATVARLDPFSGAERNALRDLPIDERLHRFRAALAGTQVFVMTVHKAWRRLEWLRSLRPQMIIVDEASQLVDAMVAGLFSLDAPFVMIGDHRQLPPIVQHPRRIRGETDTDGEEGEDEPVVSTFERMVETCRRNGWDYAHGMLVEQHRMHEEIQAFPSMHAYGGALACGSDRQRRPRSPWAEKADLPTLVTDRRVCFVDVGADPGDPARVNRREAVLAAELAARFVRSAEHVDPAYLPDGVQYVGIVAPFRVQCAAIRNELHRLGLTDQVHVDTVERFQGSERPVMIVSMTAKNQQELARTESLALDGQVDRKLNVAITRAREHLIVLGDRHVMSLGAKTLEYLSFLEMSEQIVPASQLRTQLGLV